jgi:cell division septum initiation protein DivIVA
VSGEALTTDFPLVEQGYDPDRVDEYLATQMLQLRTQLDASRHKIAELEQELALGREAEEALKLTMIVAKRASDEIIANARAEADEIVGEARREAFSLMTESRDDTESSVDEGKAIIAAARDEALRVIADVEEETERLIAERSAMLQKLREEYEAESSTLIDRINTLRSIADDLGARVTRTASAPAPTPPSPPTRTSPEPPSPTAEGGTAIVSQPETQTTREEDGDAPTAARIRESFSGRRSAKLPRIGEEAGRSALAAATAMRAHMTHEPDDSEDKPGDDDLAVRTA